LHVEYEKILTEITDLATKDQNEIKIEPIPAWVFKAIKANIPFFSARKKPVKYDYFKDKPVFLAPFYQCKID